MTKWLLTMMTVVAVVLACESDASKDTLDTATAQDSSAADTTTEADTTAPQDTTEADTASGEDTQVADVPEDAPAPVLESETLTLTTSDGKSIAASTHRMSTTADGAPGVVLIHQFTQTQAQWQPFLESFAAEGYILLSFDLRGHGASDAQDGGFTGLLTDPSQAPLDLEAALAAVVAEGADATRLAVLGTSIGANLACAAQVRDLGHQPKISIAVSARDTAVESLSGVALDQMRFQGLFILATEQDGAGAQARTARAFVAACDAPCQDRVTPGTQHGKDILSSDADAITEILTFLSTHL